ncbi:hypothetical protein ACB094_05G071900 [Castanea mollissima]
MGTLSLLQWQKMQASHHRHIPPKTLTVQMVVCSPRLSRKAECYEHKTKLLVKDLPIAGHKTCISLHTLNLAFNIGHCP